MLHPTLLLALLATAPEKPTIETLAPHAAGVALVEVTAAKKYDERPSDGNAGVEFQFKILRKSGKVRTKIRVITAIGGARPAGAKPFKPSGPVKHDSFTSGKRYWIAFSAERDWKKYPQLVVCFHPESAKPAANLFDKAITANRYRWQPQYDRKLNLSYGYIESEVSDRWRIRVTRNGKTLWEKDVPGKKTGNYMAWTLYAGRMYGIPATLPKCGNVLYAQSTVELDAKNEYKIPAKTYNVITGYDPQTGRRVATWVVRHQSGWVNELHVDYHPKTGKPITRARWDSPTTGGRAIGGKKEAWWRKTVTRYDPKTGRETGREIYRYDETKPSSKAWVKVRSEKR